MPRYLIVESESEHDREARREHAGKSSAESYAATLRQMRPRCTVDVANPVADGAEAFDPEHIATYDAVFVSGSPVHVYDDGPYVAQHIAFMQTVFASGTPSFGSCAGLQLAVAAAGGTVRRMDDPVEAGIARRIVATGDGCSHPLLAGRPATWDAPAVHSDEVETLPEGATLLAGNAVTRVQAAEIRHDRGVFWGVQYHPELAPGEIAAALRRQSDALVESGLTGDSDDVERYATLLDALQDDPGRHSARWLLGVDDEFAVEARRRRELDNFLTAAPDLKTV